ncbi:MULTISPECIES: glutamine synthetase family protein [unclassified Spirosoma]|uniref:glutamine synthetase family protein n=1 Tax=unclassified Spirosoma TaxID=2621999 RepID=UPI000967088E|nr:MULTISPECIES: glutamine synthetase family protein [unclassified Spirosoma]MBN8823123.1 glutamine synthetase [Spirosoma sp.]OJW73212.1 MAG: glutamine synthetase [Spirosoma sp. 48-14]
MDQQAIIDFIKQSESPKIKYAFTDIDGVLRGKIIHRQKFLDGLNDGFGFCDVVWGWDSSDTPYDNGRTTGWHSGYPDAPVRIDVSTFRQLPWQDNIPFFLADFSSKAGQEPNAYALASCPRSLLKRIADQCHQMGFHARFAQEFEWFNFRETPRSLQEKSFLNLEPLTPGMFGYSILRPSLESAFYHDLFDLLARFDIPLEGLHTETGPGVYEAAIMHDEVVRAADKAVLFKTAVKEIAYRHGIIATFMAKWNADLPGCSGHIHQSLWSLDQSRNLFFDASQPNQMSELMQQFMAGQLYCLPHITPMFAPTINSYKRLVEGAWAPTTITWSVDNRTTALRVLNHKEAYTRVEHRVSGSDTNPYLAIAASLASGLYGIRHKLTLDIPASAGNGYADKRNGILPTNLDEATQAMAHSPVAAELFGAEFVDHFTRTRNWEWRQYLRQVSDWELKRYFEII